MGEIEKKRMGRERKRACRCDCRVCNEEGKTDTEGSASDMFTGCFAPLPYVFCPKKRDRERRRHRQIDIERMGDIEIQRGTETERQRRGNRERQK